MSIDEPGNSPADDNQAAPSGREVFDSLREVAHLTSDGRYQEKTIYADGVPLITLVPYQEPVVIEPVETNVMVRLSRFAYLHRVGNDLRLETPLAAEYLNIHDPRIGALIAAMDFDRTPADLADESGLELKTACEVLGAMRAMQAADTVIETRDVSAPINAAMQWAANGGIPGAWWNHDVSAAVHELPWHELGDSFEILWELHHPASSGRVDLSISMPDLSKTPRFRRLYREYDLSSTGTSVMGEFFEIDHGDLGSLKAALTERGSPVAWSSDGAVAALLADVGWPTWVGVLERETGVRLVIPLTSVRQLTAAGSILKRYGIEASIVDRFALLEPLIGGQAPARLTVDAVDDRLGPRVGLEVVNASAIALLPGVLDALGVSADVIDEVVNVGSGFPQETRLNAIPGVVTDAQSRVVSHVKVGFESGGHVAVKSYVGLRNLPLAVGGRSVEDNEVPPTWEFHDLLFHSRSRNGRVREKLGGTSRFSIMGQIATFDTQPGPGDIVLPHEDVAALVKGDRPFGEVMRARVSDRDWTGPQIELPQLSQLLARVMEVIPREVDFGGDVQAFDGQPYPSGGAIYEVDVVVIAHRVSDLPPGAYLYRRGAHSLQPLDGDLADMDALLFGASEATGNGVVRPQALLILAARFPDLAVKYQGIAYALMLKHVGVIQAAIAYTATAMGLGAVPVGTGDSDVFARATGLDYYVHGSIGEIALSSRPGKS